LRKPVGNGIEAALEVKLTSSSMAEIPNLRLSLSNSPENVLLVRQALSGLAEAIDLDPLELNDINTAVSEACNNVVVHAYEGGEGPLEVDIRGCAPALRVLVRDHGRGIAPAVIAANGEDGAEQGVGGIGLPVIRALAHDAEFRDLAGGGTEVQMDFATARAGALEPPSPAEEPELLAIGPEGHVSTMALTIAPSALARTILPRLLCALAARAHFSTDRISDTQLLADTLVAQTDGALSAAHLGVAIGVAPRKLELRIGPLRIGRAGAIVLDSTVDGLGPVIERLVDAYEVTVEGSSEILALLVAAEH
jgi:serine/threonine-protein kinase RsbW